MDVGVGLGLGVIASYNAYNLKAQEQPLTVIHCRSELLPLITQSYDWGGDISSSLQCLQILLF